MRAAATTVRIARSSLILGTGLKGRSGPFVQIPAHRPAQTRITVFRLTDEALHCERPRAELARHPVPTRTGSFTGSALREAA